MGYIQETTYKYVGCGGDFDTVRPKRDFTCIITSCCLLSLLLLLPLLCWLLSGTATTLPYDCDANSLMWETAWSEAQKDYCCSTMGRGCGKGLITTQPATAPVTIPPTPPPTLPPTPPPTPPHTLPPTRPVPSGPVDPFNCAV